MTRPGIMLGAVLLLGAGLFAGLMVATAGGALHPPLLRVAAPFVCDGDLVIESRRHSYKPGQVGVYHTVLCQPAGPGSRTDVTLPAIFVATLVYSGAAAALGAAVGVPVAWWLRRRIQAMLGKSGPTMDAATWLRTPARLIAGARRATSPAIGSATDGKPAGGPAAASDTAERLRALRALLDERLITPQEYEAKRAQILNEL